MSDKASFSPRPEAHAMELSKMLPPVEKATCNLLERIHGALRAAYPEESKSKAAPPKVPATSAANCFLVTGERGTGKTTVLLSAQKLVEPGQDENSAKELPEDISRLAKEIAEHAEWLDVLDVEPLPPKTNLLTVLLVLIRNAIAPRTEGGHGEPRASIFEERADSAYERLNKLIQDAALIWEDIHESSTRDRIERQVAAAETFSRFKHDFDKTFAGIADQRAKEKGKEKRKAFVLPIDNIDRSPEHLQSIFKLAQMVSSKHLWLVLAGDRVDLNTLLERVYWKELFQTSVGTVAGAKEHRGEDESLSIARRQAAATIRKILPPNHRIEVKLVEPDDALAFKLPGEGETLLELLEKITVFNTEEDKKGTTPAMAERTSLAALLTLDDCFESDAKTLLQKEDAKNLPVLHGWDALRLPARTLLDLAQLAQRESVKKTNKEKKHSAAYIARSMYRLAIAESALPEWLTEELQERLIQRSGEHTTINTDKHGQALHLVRVRQPVSVVPGSERRSQIYLVKSRDILLSVGEEKNDGDQLEYDGSSNPEYLPPIAAGWLLVLHDVLTIIPRPLVFSSKRLPENAAEHVKVSWSFPQNEGTWKWPWPRWRTLFEMSAASAAWHDTLQRVQDRQELMDDPKKLRKILALAWIDIACWLSEEGAEPWPVNPIESLLRDDEKKHDPIARAAALLTHLEKKASKARRLQTGSEWRDDAAYDWLRLDLPLLFVPELDTGLRWNDAKALHSIWEKDKEEIAALRRMRLHEAIAGKDDEVNEDDLSVVIEYFNKHRETPFKMKLPGQSEQQASKLKPKPKPQSPKPKSPKHKMNHPHRMAMMPQKP